MRVALIRKIPATLASAQRRRLQKMHATPNEISQTKLQDDIIIALAKQSVQASCYDDLDEAACAVAWDNMDEIYRGLFHRKEYQETDPLEIYCSTTPEGDECREYDV